LDLFSVIADNIGQTGFLEGVTEELHTRIIGLGNKMTVKSGEMVFRQGDPAHRCFFVLNGRLKLTKLHEQGKTVVIRYIGPGELTAAIAVFKGKNYPVTAEGVGNTEVVGWGKQTMVNLMLEYPRLAVNMLRAAIDRIEDLQDRYLELCAEQVEQRIARALLRIMQQSGRKTDEGIAIDFRLSRQELAEYTGTTHYTVSRVLSAWEKKGWVKSKREHIVILDPHALVLFAENR